MKVLHLPIEIAGQMGMLCGALKYYGHKAMGYNYFHTYLAYRNNILPADGLEITNVVGEAIDYFDLFHFHHLLTAFTDYRDLEMLAAAGKPAIMHHWGSDVRTENLVHQWNPYLTMTGAPSEEEVHAKLLKVSQYISTALVQDYEVLPYVKSYYQHVHVLPLAIDTAAVKPVYPSRSEKNPLVIHAPTNPQFKGTSIIEKVIERLQKEICFRYRRIENMNNTEAKSLYAQADIVIDQILMGSYGMLCIECMTLGKPVITYLRDDLISQYATKPLICNANPDTLYDVLKQLLVSPELRHDTGVQARTFAEQFHDMKVVGTQLIRIYLKLLADV